MAALTKVLFIGLDSAEPRLLLEWSRAGVLPTLRALMDAGAWGSLECPPGQGNGALWPSLFTGVNAGRHGRYYHRQWRAGTYDSYRFDDDRDLRHEPVWSALSRAGRRVAVVDMVRAPLTERINGIQLADWMTHDRLSPPRSWPPELLAEATERFGSDPFNGRTEKVGRSAAEFKAFRDLCIQRVATKTELSRSYLAKGGWDLFMTVFGDPHDLGHQCWHLHDPRHPKHDPQWRQSFGDPIQDLYRAIDAALHELLVEAGSDTTVVVFSGPGMGPNYTANFLLDKILRRLEAPAHAGSPSISRVMRSAHRRLVPTWLDVRLRALRRLTGRGRRSSRRESRRYFAVPHNGLSGAIRFNLVGREPSGRVYPGPDYDSLCDSLSRDLLELTDLNTGVRVVKEVVRASDWYRGDALANFPDLLAIWNREAPFSCITSPKLGTLSVSDPGSRTGDHTGNTLLIVRGPTVAPGPIADGAVVEDLAPTLASMLGVALPDADGAPMPALLQAARSNA